MGWVRAVAVSTVGLAVSRDHWRGSSLGLLILAGVSLASRGDGDSLGRLVVDTGVVVLGSGVSDLGVVVVDGSRGLGDLVGTGGRGVDGGVLDDSLGHGLVTLNLGLVASIGSSDVASLSGSDGLSAVGAGLTSLGGGGSLSRVVDRVIDYHVLAGDDVDARLLVNLDLWLGLAMGVDMFVLGPLSTLVLLDVNGLLLVTLGVETRATVSGKSLGAKVLVWNLLNLLIKLVPAVSSAVLGGSASGSSIATSSSSRVSNGRLGVVDNDWLLSVGDSSVVVVVVLDDSGDVGVLSPLGTALVAISRSHTGWVRLVLGGHGDRLLAIAGNNGGVANGGCGCAWLDAGVSIGTISAVGLVGCGGSSEDDSVLHCDELVELNITYKKIVDNE